MTDPEKPVDDPEPDEDDGDGGGDTSDEGAVIDEDAPTDGDVGE